MFLRKQCFMELLVWTCANTECSERKIVALHVSECLVLITKIIVFGFGPSFTLFCALCKCFSGLLPFNVAVSTKLSSGKISFLESNSGSSEF